MNAAPPQAASQCAAILQHLQSGKKLTGLDALSLFGCFRLGARIWDLKEAGHPILSARVQKGNKHVAEYSMLKVQ